MTQVLLGFGGGILLGLRWKFAVLYPATLLVAVFMIGTTKLSWQNAGLIVLVITALQVGYLCGVAARELAKRFRSMENCRDAEQQAESWHRAGRWTATNNGVPLSSGDRDSAGGT